MTTYRPDPRGAWIALVRDARALVLEAAHADDATVAALWSALAEDDPTTLVIERLTAGGLGKTPSFALVYRRGGTGVARAVVRGPIEVRLGAERIDGREVSTWSERTAIDAETLGIIAGDADAAGDAPAWPLLAGIVLSGRVDVEDDGTAGAAGSLSVPGSATRAPATAPSPVDTPAAAPPAAAPRPPSFAEQTIVPAPDPGGADDHGHTIEVPAFGGGAAAAPEPGLGDHDGMTVAASDIRRLREERERARAPQAASAGPIAPVLRLPGGGTEAIGHEVLIGRAPSANRVTGDRLPKLVRVGVDDPDISRTHVRLGLEGDTVVVTDLDSRNGTIVVQPGKAPVRLRGSEPTPVLVGTVIDLGGGVTLGIEAP